VGKEKVSLGFSQVLKKKQIECVTGKVAIVHVDGVQVTRVVWLASTINKIDMEKEKVPLGVLSSVDSSLRVEGIRLGLLGFLVV